MTARNIHMLLFVVFIPVLVSIVWLMVDFTPRNSERCKTGHFILPGMKACHSWLNCNQINEEISVYGIIGLGAVKMVKRGLWRNHEVAVNILANQDYIADFSHGLNMLQQLQSTVNVTQFVGVCKQQDIFITEFHRLGSADHLELILNTDSLQSFNSLSVRFGLCRQYVKILHTLHNSVNGARVMCDSNDLNKTLSQFLLRDDLSLVLNDVDALPVVDKSQGQLIKCGHHELFGDFVAPEQLWPFEDKNFSDSEMPGYDEKVDIWKVPDVCDAFLGDVQDSSKLRLQLLHVHLKCKSLTASDRPSALDLLRMYKSIHDTLKL